MHAVEKPLVAIVMGSKSDWEWMKHADETLAKFGVGTRAAVHVIDGGEVAKAAGESDGLDGGWHLQIIVEVRGSRFEVQVTRLKVQGGVRRSWRGPAPAKPGRGSRFGVSPQTAVARFRPSEVRRGRPARLSGWSLIPYTIRDRI